MRLGTRGPRTGGRRASAEIASNFGVRSVASLPVLVIFAASASSAFGEVSSWSRVVVELVFVNPVGLAYFGFCALSSADRRDGLFRRV